MSQLTDRERARALQRLDRLSEFMDSKYRIPLTGIHFGWDAIGGLVPVAGDVATTAVGAYLVWEARKLGATGGLFVRMAGNVALDTLISVVPVVGSVFDIFFRANERNLKLLLDHVQQMVEKDRARQSATRPGKR
ncbi:MAG: DUF4112 domain-containing protein [Pseudomonadota bacterium]|nr:DUF4112 domain-containing protein [Pseudomonadota bacterium]